MSDGVLYLLRLPRIMDMEYPPCCVYPYFQLKNKEWWSTAEKDENLIRVSDGCLKIDKDICHGFCVERYNLSRRSSGIFGRK